MTLGDIIRRSWHNIGRAKVRVGLTAAALAVGAATMTLAFAITEGAKDSIEKGFGELKNTYVNVEGFAPKNTAENGVQTTEEAQQAQQQTKSKSLGVKDAENFKKIEGVEKVIPLTYFRFDSVELQGKSYKAPTVSPLTPLSMVPSLVAGNRDNLKDDTVIIPERYAKQAGAKNPSEFIGKSITFVQKGYPAFYTRPATPDKRVTLKVVGITKSSGGSGGAVLEQGYMAPETLSKLANEANGSKDPEDVYYSQILVVTNEKKTETVKESLQDQGYSVKTRQDSLGEALKAIAVIRTILLVFAGIAIFTAIFGVVNTQLMSVLERTREIGLMKALGLSRRGILLMFSIEAGWIGFIGSIIGTLIALPFAILLSVLGGDTFDAPITLPNFLLVVIVLVVIAMLSGLLPARRAAKLDPVEALRNE